MMLTHDSEGSSYQVGETSCSKESEFEVLGGVQITYEEQLDTSDPFTRSLTFKSKDRASMPKMSLTLKTALKNDPLEEDLNRIQGLMRQRALELAQMKQDDSTSELSKLRGELAKLKAEVRHYERQNSDLRKEIKLSTDSLTAEHQRQIELREEAEQLREEADQLRDSYMKLCEMLKELVLQLDDSCAELEDPRLMVNNIGSSLQLLLSRQRRMSTHYEHLLTDNRKLSKEIEGFKNKVKQQAAEHFEAVIRLNSDLNARGLSLQQAKLQVNALKRQMLKGYRASRGEKVRETPFNSPCVLVEDMKSDAGSEEQTKPGTITSSQDSSRRHSRTISEVVQRQPPLAHPLEQVKAVQRSVSPIAEKGYLKKLRARTKRNSLPRSVPPGADSSDPKPSPRLPKK
jgi:DNA repair exonuclease SbcCD ATPase subunit